MKTQRTIAGRFRLGERLGEGAFAVVYAAQDIVLGRGVALKVPRLALDADPDAVQRITDEAAAAARLNDPHVVTIYDVVDDGGRPIVVMESVSGKSLAQILHERGTLPLAETLVIAEAIAHALGHAHRFGIIHRDVKPSNVLIGDAGEIKLTDFGFARQGTLFYLAPELLAGAEATPASDIYALGVLVSQMVGTAPMPPQLAQLLERMRAKSPRERPSDAEAIAQEFATWRTSLETDPLFAPTVRIAPRPPPAPEPPRTAPLPDVSWPKFSWPKFSMPKLPPLSVSPGYAVRALALTALGLGALSALLLLATRPRGVLVPDLRNSVAAAATIGSQLGLHVRVISQSSRTVPRGKMIRQEPAPGTRVIPGSEVRVVVSSGAPLVSVPDLTGINVFEAAAIAAAKHLQLKAQPRFSDAPPTQIVDQSPDPGTNVPEHSSILVGVSTGVGPGLAPAVGPPPDGNKDHGD